MVAMFFSRKYLVNSNERQLRQFSKIITLPFQISAKQALDNISKQKGIFEKGIKENNNKSYSKKKLLKAYIPFHTGSIHNLASTFVGEYGNDRIEVYITSQSDGKGGRMPAFRTRTVTDWYPVTGQTSCTNYNEQLEIGKLHVYADFDFPKAFVQNCLAITNVPKTCFQEIEPDQISKVFPHSMNDTMALNELLACLQCYEQAKAEQYIKMENKSDRARVTEVRMKLEDMTLHRFSYHVPAYLYVTTVDNKKICKIVNGYNGACDGDHVTSTFKVGMGGTIVGTVLAVCSLFVFPIYGGVARLIAIRVGLGTLTGGLIGSLSSHFYTKYQYETSRFDMENDKIVNKQHDFALLELQVDTELSLTILKNAKIKQTKKWHPDVYKGDRKFANVMTVKINDAYESLCKLL